MPWTVRWSKLPVNCCTRLRCWLPRWSPAGAKPPSARSSTSRRSHRGCGAQSKSSEPTNSGGTDDHARSRATGTADRSEIPAAQPSGVEGDPARAASATAPGAPEGSGELIHGEGPTANVDGARPAREAQGVGVHPPTRRRQAREALPRGVDARGRRGRVGEEAAADRAGEAEGR